jgi:ribose transport system substrate-binding protein
MRSLFVANKPKLKVQCHSPAALVLHFETYYKYRSEDEMRPPASPSQNRYVVQSILHAARVLSAFRSTAEVLRLRDIVVRTGFKRAMCFRLLYTLHECGMIEKVRDHEYRSLITRVRPQRYRLGYANYSPDSSFAQEVTDGLVRACQIEGLELIRVDNTDDREAAFRNAERLVKERVDLAIEFQAVEAAAPIVASKFRAAGIPLIAVDIPHPGAIYFGADNFEAGSLAGRCLGQYAKQHWQGVVDEIIMIEAAQAGVVASMRVDGMRSALREVLPNSSSCPVISINGRGSFKTTLAQVRKHLRTSTARRILVGASNDPGALGALRAFQEIGRSRDCVVVGHSAEPDVRVEMRQPHTRLIGSVAYFPEKYGEHIVRLALDMLSGTTTPPAVFMKHRLITPQNVNHSYPNDSLFLSVW